MPVVLTAVVLGGHDDQRRVIHDIVLPPLSFPIIQIKTVRFKADGVGHMVAGNHYHTKESNRYEFFVADGPESGENPGLIEFAYRDQPGGLIARVWMRRGDACFVPPGCSHAFRALVEGAFLWGFSNLPYDAAHDVPDKLM